MEITKNENNYLLKNSKGEYHLSIEDYEKLGEKEAIILAEKEINKKLNANYSNKTINFEKARDLGFCEFGIKDFCKRLDLDIDKTYKLLELKEKLYQSKYVFSTAGNLPRRQGGVPQLVTRKSPDRP